MDDRSVAAVRYGSDAVRPKYTGGTAGLQRVQGLGCPSTLLEEFKGFLVVDAAPSFNAIVSKNELATVLCNDHSRRKFVEAGRNATKGKKNGSSEEWVATKAIAFNKRLYKLEEQIRELPPGQRLEKRQREALPSGTRSWNRPRRYRHWECCMPKHVSRSTI